MLRLQRLVGVSRPGFAASRFPEVTLKVSTATDFEYCSGDEFGRALGGEAGVANLIGVKNSRRVVVLHKDGQIEVGIAEHLEFFVAGSSRTRGTSSLIAGGEDSSDGKLFRVVRSWYPSIWT